MGVTVLASELWGAKALLVGDIGFVAYFHTIGGHCSQVYNLVMHWCGVCEDTLQCNFKKLLFNGEGGVVMGRGIYILKY